jgi:hypothetical protein
VSTVTARECAARWGVSPARARRILAPLPPAGRDLATGAMLYDREMADAARAAMPGQGKRTDLPARP